MKYTIRPNINGVSAAKEEGSLRYIAPGEKVELDVTLSILEGEELLKTIDYLERL